MATASAKSLKIGLVLDDSLDKVDGVQQYLLNVGEWLRTQGHDVHYLVGETVRTDLRGVHSLSRNLKVRFNGNRMSMPLPTAPGRLRKFVTNERFDVLHVQLPYSPYLAHRLLLAAGPQTALIGTFHILPDSALARRATKLLGLWTARSLKRFDTIFSVSSAARDFAKHTFGVSSTVLPNVFDYRLFHDAKPLASSSSELTIMFLGRLVPRKGCQVLLEAVNLLKQESGIPKFRVVICGKGPLAEKLQRYVVDNDLSDIVEFSGFVSETDKPSYYAAADITVFPSRGGESFGIVLLEAMASGHAAVLAGDNPGYRSVLTAKPELLFDPHDARGLAAKLRVYLTDGRLRQEAQAWGMEYTRDFDTEIVGQKLLVAYDKALRKRRGP